jgi:hypothetical protein
VKQGGAEEPVYGENVSSGMSRSERRQAAKKAGEMQEKLEEAKQLKEAGKTEEAKEKLREVHGDKFK